ncbi:hypothetical protein PV10_01175 [Exophiala mesophila]|uniref:Cryptic loci regulator 2 N-terminal domain-containing protein n=1 Tax=Exophiala mesophila TaxID=212818 RepID=A0A0D1X6G4_EXOME|nr:uncharacterized protein PV10_01175 [Exophiala mesophila]KIV97420.1 hypothetical protein PV10_01175 [Exophiala mesophila]
MGTKGHRQVRYINSVSDGDQRHWPPKPYRASDEQRYLNMIGSAWAQQDGLAGPGAEFAINKLPAGYSLFEIDQPGGPQVYKRLFGHPSGTYFDSAQKFLPHFLWLMSNMAGDCSCILCKKAKHKSSVKRSQPPGVSKPSPGRQIIPRPNARKPRNALDPSLIISDSRKQQMDGDSNGSSRSHSLAGNRRPQRQIRASGAPYAVDAFGHEDVYKDLVRRLWGAKDSKQGIEDDILQPNTMDWRAGHEHDGHGRDVIERCITSIAHQHSFIPRVGELVLWIPHFMDRHFLMVDDETPHGEFKFYSPDQKCFHGHPDWRGGVVVEAPIASSLNRPIDFPDIQCLTESKRSLNTSGFRIETFPDPNNEVDKSASKQYRYVPMRNIRPLSQWHVLLRGIPEQKWHPSIRHALTCMTSISLMEKFWFSGKWPEAKISCKAMYLGSELITVGDVVRIKPDPSGATRFPQCTDVMIVDAIRLHLGDIRQEYIAPDHDQLASAYTLSLKGRAYTLDARRSFDKVESHAEFPPRPVAVAVDLDEIKAEFRPVGAADYGPWYRLHDPKKFYAITQDMVLGRLYESGAVQLWTGQLQRKQKPGAKIEPPSLNFDVHGITEGRRYATKHDLRLDEVSTDEIQWFWADDRAEALDLEMFNGVKVGRFADFRDKPTQEQWRRNVRIIDGHTVANDYSKYTQFTEIQLPGATRGRKPGSKVVNGKVLYPGHPDYGAAVAAGADDVPSTPRKHNSQLAGAALVSTDEESSSEDAEEYEDALEDHPTGDTVGASGILETSAPPPKPAQALPRTKQQIMGSVEDVIELDDDSSSDDQDWLEGPPPLIRGGTEESEGGDYRPD